MRNEPRKRTVLVSLVIAMLAGTLAATAGPPPGPINGPDPVFVAVRLLDLSEAQRAQWQEILEAREDATRPIAHEVQRRERELRRVLDGDAPDPGMVGQLVIEIDGLQDQIRAIRDASGEELLGTLDDAQLELVDEAAAAAPLVPAVRSFQALGLI